MRNLLVILALALAPLPLASPALAQSKSAPPAMRGGEPPGLPGIGSYDPRAPVSVRESPWNALGVVRTTTGGRCTGTLIAPDVVLTAAHCLISPRNRHFVEPDQVQFMQGYDRGRFSARAEVRSYRVGPGYDPQARGPGREDWAVLLLARSLRGPTLPVFTREVEPRTPLLLGGYQQDRPEELLADTGCRLLDRLPGILLHDCAGTRGASGAPLLVRDGRGWAVAGIASRVAPNMALGQAVEIGAVRHAIPGPGMAMAPEPLRRK